MPPPQTTLLLLFITILTLLHNTTTQNQNQDLDTDCTSKYIHIRQLPPQFNTHLLTNCSNTHHPFFPSNLCQHIPNQSLGPTTHNTSHSWFRTDPTLLEHFFHTRMLEYPCLTNDPTLADVIYVPYYTVLDSLKYLYGDKYNYSDQHGFSLYEYLAREDTAIWDRHMGHDHFVVLAGSAWDYIQPLSNGGDNGGDGVRVSRVWGSSFLEMGEFFNVTVLVYESRAYPFQEMSIPYMTSFHPPSLGLFDSWVRRVREARRPVLMMFAGGGGISTSPNVRRSIRLECEANVDLCEFVDCSNGICEHDPIKFMKPMLRASFCLQPPGDTPTRRSTFDSILAGCIPVFFEELSAKKQYVWHLPEDEYDEFSVMIPKEDVVFKGASVVEVLKGIPKSRVRKMRKKLIEMIPRIVYRRHGSSLGLRNQKDAFDIAVEVTETKSFGVHRQRENLFARKMRGEEKGADHNSDHGMRAVHRSRRFGRRGLLFWLFSFAAICSICIAAFGFKMFFHGVEEHQSIPTLTSVKEISTSVEDVPVEPEIIEPPKKKPPRGRGGNPLQHVF